MPKQTKKERMLDELANSLKGVHQDKLESLLVKSARMNLRVTPVEKTEIQQTAKRCGLTATEYLLSCHRVVSQRLSRSK